MYEIVDVETNQRMCALLKDRKTAECWFDTVVAVRAGTYAIRFVDVVANPVMYSLYDTDEGVVFETQYRSASYAAKRADYMNAEYGGLRFAVVEVKASVQQ